MDKETILHHFQDINFYYNDCMMYDDLSRMLDELIAENKGEWIPVSVRLPEDGQSVNVTIQGNHVVYVTTATWDEMRRCFYNLGLPFRDVVAWCKLPEPYKIPLPFEKGASE